MTIHENDPVFRANLIGMPDSHAAMFKQIAMMKSCVIMSRATGPTCKQLLEQGYDTKGFRIHGKSCDWGPMAGFVLRDPRLNKSGAAKADYNRKEHKTAEDVLKVMTAKDKDKDVRKKAFEILAAAASATFDPDLQGQQKRGQISKRGEFARKQLIPLLTQSDAKGGDRTSRDYANQILGKWFPMPQGKAATDIVNYNQDDPKTWPPCTQVTGSPAAVSGLGSSSRLLMWIRVAAMTRNSLATSRLSSCISPR